jgi:hypothetical protein
VTTNDWRSEARRAVAERIAKSELELRGSYVSPSGTYQLVVHVATAQDSDWKYSVGHISTVHGQHITTIERNYGAFPFTWIESHPNGHDYLVCGEDYQGQTLVELDTGERVDYRPDEAEAGTGFCWAAHYVSHDRRFLAVDGCYWACPYELVIFNFSTPMTLPYRELARGPLDNVLNDGFADDGSISWTATDSVRASDGTSIDDLDETETEALLDDRRRYRMDLLADVTRTRTWRPGAPITVS